jgi:hypothetical protein
MPANRAYYIFLFLVLHAANFGMFDCLLWHNLFLLAYLNVLFILPFSIAFSISSKYLSAFLVIGSVTLLQLLPCVQSPFMK